MADKAKIKEDIQLRKQRMKEQLSTYGSRLSAGNKDIGLPPSNLKQKPGTRNAPAPSGSHASASISGTNVQKAILISTRSAHTSRQNSARGSRPTSAQSGRGIQQVHERFK